MLAIMRWTKPPEPQQMRHKPAAKIDMDTLKQDIATYFDAHHHERASRLGIGKGGIWQAMGLAST